MFINTIPIWNRYSNLFVFNFVISVLQDCTGMANNSSIDEFETSTNEEYHSFLCLQNIDNFPLCGSSYCIPASDDGIPPGCHHRFCPLDPRFRIFTISDIFKDVSVKRIFYKQIHDNDKM